MDAFLDKLRYTTEVSTNYSLYHLLWLLLLILLIYYLLKFYRHMDDLHFRIMLLIVGFFYMLGETTKLCILWHHDGAWNVYYSILPWQFCSTPIFFTWIAALIRNKRIYQGFLTYLAFYCLVAGGITILNPESIFSEVAFNNLHTLLLHGGMVVIAIYIIGSNRLDLNIKSFLVALAIFAVSAGIALGLNLYFYYARPDQPTDFFFINPFIIWGPPFLINIRNFFPYPIYLLGYLFGFSGLSFGLFCLERLRQRLTNKKESKPEELPNEA